MNSRARTALPPIPAATRRAVLATAGATPEYPVGICSDCYVRDRLELHHLHYNTVGTETPEDLHPLCRDCHYDRHVYWGIFWADPEELDHFRWLAEKDD